MSDHEFVIASKVPITFKGRSSLGGDFPLLFPHIVPRSLRKFVPNVDRAFARIRVQSTDSVVTNQERRKPTLADHFGAPGRDSRSDVALVLFWAPALKVIDSRSQVNLDLGLGKPLGKMETEGPGTLSMMGTMKSPLALTTSRTTKKKVARISIYFLTEFAGLGCGFESRGVL
ncbi:hypothetical protein HPP92_014507 [Vanilla planifolia]|uniref:Uncharacterized protein n=1 Tax=Vanilla planifolia TaxID=51239 RepID=A0A835QLM1_VANPL|nr:hypothetical protein HPP92_014507 [Vanilla planifolia]